MNVNKLTHETAFMLAPFKNDDYVEYVVVSAQVTVREDILVNGRAQL